MNRSLLDDTHPVRRWAPWALVSLVALAVLATHFLAVERCPLPVYGTHGAEYLEHQARDAFARKLADEASALVLLKFPHHLTELDDGYPPLLHLMGVLWGRVVGEGIPAAIHLNIFFLLVLGIATAEVTRRLGRVFGGPPSGRWAVALAVIAVWLLPAVFGTARRYYYDLPMATWCTVALAGLLGSRRSAPALAFAVLGSAAALLTKWTAGFYLFPMWVCALVLGMRHPPRRNTVIRLGAAGVLVVVLCWPCLRDSTTVHGMLSPIPAAVGVVWERPRVSHGNSFDSAFNTNDHIQPLDLGSQEGRRLLGERLRFYRIGLVRSSLGPLMALALVFCAAIGWRSWRTTALMAGLGLPPILWLALRVDVVDERFLLPYLPLVTAGVAAAWGCAGRERWQAAGLVAVVVAGALQLSSVQGWVPLGDLLSPMASVQERGWSPLGTARCTPFESVDRIAAAACEIQDQDGQIALLGTPALHFGIGWTLSRHCDQDLALLLEDDDRDILPSLPSDPTPRPRTAWLLDHHPTGWPPPVDRVDMDSEDPATLYLFVLPGVEADPGKPLTIPAGTGDNSP